VSQWLPAPLPPDGPALISHEREPENAEFPFDQLNHWLTPNHAFYRRNHFPYPQVDADAWRLEVTGAVRRPLRLTLPDLQRMPQALQWTTLECSGNKRAFFHPPAEGTQWGPGAIGTAEWGGVPLAQLLSLAGVRPGAVAVLFTGADNGVFKATGEHVHFARSLPLAEARRADVLLALTMNGEPLPPRHGAPLRLVVPGWYAMAAVKWLTRIEVRTEPFSGPFQSRDYVYLPQPGTPVTVQKVNAAIAQPTEGAQVPPGPLTIRGAAWGGAQRVDVSIDGGWRWQQADWAGPALPHAWRLWQTVTPPLRPGRYVLAARAAGPDQKTQPLAAPWNAKGYGNNAIVPVRITVAEP
jgi:DMSO/TMAO reductase YedYZ molybdopterin-dependent catalytic subunit